MTAVLLDTHVFVWFAGDRSRLSKAAQRAITKSSRRLILDITLREVARLTATGRLRFDRDVETWLEDATLANGIEVVPIDAMIAARSIRIAAHFHGDPVDQLIAATSIVLEVPLITADENLRASAALRTIW